MIRAKIIGGVAGLILGGSVTTVAIFHNQTYPVCDGIEITTRCQDEEGNKYKTYIYHPAQPEKTKEIKHIILI